MTTVSDGEGVLFAFVATAAVLCALTLLFSRKAVHAAISMVGVMLSLAVLYITLQAPFLGMAQIVVYTGAIMMLFLFVLMLVGVDASDSRVETLKGQRWIGYLAAGGLGVIIVSVVTRAAFVTPTHGLPEGGGAIGADGELISNPQALARVLFSDFLFTMEVVAILLVTAALAALVLTHRRRATEHKSQRQLQAERMHSSRRLTPLPAPGVYSRRNAMDVPALDPDGKPIADSISRVLRIRGQETTIEEVTANLKGRDVASGERIDEGEEN